MELRGYIVIRPGELNPRGGQYEFPVTGSFATSEQKAWRRARLEFHLTNGRDIKQLKKAGWRVATCTMQIKVDK